MTAMSGFYKLANTVQSVHDLMTITYGFPVWASYVIFGLITLACGLTAGLVIGRPRKGSNGHGFIL